MSTMSYWQSGIQLQKKLISLRRHKVSEATIENLGFAGNPVTRGTLSAPGTAMACLKEVGEKPGLQMNLASWQIMPCLHILLAVFQGNVWVYSKMPRCISRESLQNAIGQWQSYHIISHKTVHFVLKYSPWDMEWHVYPAVKILSMRDSHGYSHPTMRVPMSTLNTHFNWTPVVAIRKSNDLIHQPISIFASCP